MMKFELKPYNLGAPNEELLAEYLKPLLVLFVHRSQFSYDFIEIAER